MPTYWANDPTYNRAAIAAVTQANKGEAHLWRSCFACALVVGQYERGATIALARNMRRSVDTVEARAQAAVTYHRLLAHFRADPEVWWRVRELRRLLGYSHFAEAGRLLRQDVSPLEVFAQLDTAAREGAGTKSMGMNSRDGLLKTIELPVWDLTSTTIYELADRYGRKARIVVLPDDYERETVSVRV